MFGISVLMFGDPGDGNSIIAMLLAAIAGFLLITGIRRKQRERARAEREGTYPPAPRFPAKTAGNLDSKEKQRRDLQQLIGEIQDLSRKITAEIDTRFSKLEATIQDADQRIAVLNRLSRATGIKTLDQPGDSQDQDIRYAIVYELADAGLSPLEIAKDLGRTPGEIELILNLRRTARQ
jgi:hypothetical protein